MHKWAKEITHFVNGGGIEGKFTDGYLKRNDSCDTWSPVGCLDTFDCPDYIFRIKPQKKTMEVAVFTHPNGIPTTFTKGDSPTNPAWKQVSPWIDIEYEDPQS